MWKNYLKIKEASEFLGVSPKTLRNWDKNGKFMAVRHPSNKYRLYKISELEKFSKKTNREKFRHPKIELVD